MVFAPTTTTATDVNSLGLSATYEVNAAFSWGDGNVTFRTAASVTNPRPWPVETLAFNLSTLRTGRAELPVVTVDGAVVQPEIDDQTVIVPLPAPLERGSTTVVEFAGSARLNLTPRQGTDEWGFARNDGVMTAYRWIPWLTRTTPFDRPSVGDPFVTASSPRVEVTITSDRPATFATSGQQTAAIAGSLTFVAENVRDFNFSASPDYEATSRTVRGTQISFFHRTMSPEAVLDVAARSFDHFSERIGAYPYAQLAIAEIGPWAPLESPSLFWVPNNAPARLLPWMTAHETAHQWFYSVVGNDQAREPFADEALTDFVARDFISRFVRSQCPPGKLDRTIYDLAECYPWVIYVQGDAFLLRYRQEVGSEAFWRGLADYYAEFTFGLGGNRQALAALDAAAGRTEMHTDLFPRLYPPAFPCLPIGPRL